MTFIIIKMKKSNLATAIFFLISVFLAFYFIEKSGNSIEYDMQNFESSNISGRLSNIETTRGVIHFSISNIHKKYAFIPAFCYISKTKYVTFFEVATLGDSVVKFKGDTTLKLIKKKRLFVFRINNDR